MSERTEPWATDGEHYDTSKEIYQNRGIMDFLADGDFLKIVVSPKGMGKTLLLNKKRRQIQRRAGALVIPENKEADYVQLSASVSHKWETVLRSKQGWTDLWEFAIGLSLLTHVAQEHSTSIVRELGALMQSLPTSWNLLEDADDPTSLIKHNPSDIIALILNSSPSAFFELGRAQPKQHLFKAYTSVRHGVYVFIDSFDQALLESMQGYFDADIWTNGQLGLVKAAYKMNRHNAHIKIFLSIRAEAYANITEEDSMSMSSQMFHIRYQREDIRQMLDLLIREYEHKENIYDFVGLDTVQVRGGNEDIFDFVYRHTLGKPRGIAVLGKGIRQQWAAMEEKTRHPRDLKSLISDAAATEIVENYLFGEMLQFQTWLRDRQSVEQLMQLIPYNVLTAEELSRIAQRFARRIGYQTRANTVHPFCELYNLGLLGVLTSDMENPRLTRQTFATHDSFRWNAEKVLPRSRYYLIHPALAGSIARKNPRFRHNETALIGSGVEWQSSYTAAIDQETVRIFISYSSSNQKLVATVLDHLSEELDAAGIRHWFWFDEWRIRGGAPIQPTIEQGLKGCDFLILCYTKQARDSGWVQQEWQTKHREEIQTGKVCVIPITNLRVTNGTEAGIALLANKKFRVIPRATSDYFGDFITGLAQDIEHHAGTDHDAAGRVA